jgi:sodium/hydrogen antiporter
VTPELPPVLDGYDLLLLFAGLALLAITLGRNLLEALNLNTTYVYLAVGVLAGPLLLGMGPEDPLEAAPVLERIAEAAVIIGLIVLGLRIGRPPAWRAWRSTSRLVLLLMPATILGVAALGMLLFGLAPGPAVLLGATLAPTDPILAGPLEEDSAREDPEDRFGLSSEAGLNDGFAFPFIYLGLYLTLWPEDWRGWLGWWVGLDLVWAVALALPAGWVLGRGCGRLFMERMHHHGVSHKRRLFVPLALLLAVYGLVEVLGGYGFLAAFTAGLGFRREVEDDLDRLTRFADFTESVDELAKAATLILLGAVIPWAALGELALPLVAFALLLILVVRPVLTLLATAGAGFAWPERRYWAWFGIRGIGSVYYLSYALRTGLAEGMAPGDADRLFAITAGTILVSVLVHGLSVRPYLKHFHGAEHVEE